MWVSHGPKRSLTAVVLVSAIKTIFFFLPCVQLAKDGEYILLERVLERMSAVRAQKKCNKKDRDRYAPLHYAVRYCHVEASKVLVKYGASGWCVLAEKCKKN